MMTEAGFTQGPWRVLQDGPVLRIAAAEDADDRSYQVASIDPYGLDPNPDQDARAADAALIAAAPDMYVALEAIAKRLDFAGSIAARALATARTEVA